MDGLFQAYHQKGCVKIDPDADTLGDLDDVLSTPTGYPFIQVFYNVTHSKAGATAMSCILVLSSVANGMTNMATASRQLFAFARDGGVPFHRWFATVSPHFEIPLNGKYLWAK